MPHPSKFRVKGSNVARTYALMATVMMVVFLVGSVVALILDLTGVI